MARTERNDPACVIRTVDCSDIPGVCSFFEEDYITAMPETRYGSEGSCTEIRLLVRGIQPVVIGEEEFTLHGGDMLILREEQPFSTLHRLQYRAAYLILRVDLPSIRRG